MSAWNIIQRARYSESAVIDITDMNILEDNCEVIYEAPTAYYGISARERHRQYSRH